MTGWKTKLAAALAIIYGVAGWLLGLHDLDAAMNYLITGTGLLGVGHKIEKAGAAYDRQQNRPLPDVVRDAQSD